MGFQSIFTWEGLPEAGFAKRALIHADRRLHERFALRMPHRNLRPIPPQAPQSGIFNGPLFEHASAFAAQRLHPNLNCTQNPRPEGASLRNRLCLMS
jgi:hypothetical protein